MKVLHLIRSLKKGGAEKICVDICTELNRRKDLEVLLVSMSAENAFKNYTQKIPFKIINSKVLPSITRKSIIDTKEYEKILDDFKPDIVHSHLFWSELLAKQCLRDHITYVTHCHDNMREFENFKFSSIVNKQKLIFFFEKRWMLKRIKNCNNHFITISKNTTDYFHRVLPRELQKIDLIPNAIFVEKYKKPEHHIKKNQILTLINVGRFWGYKNQSFLIDVAKKLEKQKVKFKMYLIGDGPELKNVKEKAESLKTNTLFFPGNVDNVHEYLWESDIYIHSSKKEAFGLVLIEAMAAGLPVLTTNGKGNIDVIEHGENGYILPEDANVFLKKINELTQDKKLYSKLSNFCEEYAKNYDIENYTIRLIDYYKSILNKSK